MKELTITKEMFDNELVNAEKPVLIDFWASWCGPCQKMGPVIEKLAEEHDEVIVGKVNVDDEDDLSEQFNIMSIPTIILFDKGVPVKKIIGYHPYEELEEFIKQ